MIRDIVYLQQTARLRGALFIILEESRFLSEGIPWPEKLIFEAVSGKIDISAREERS